MRFAQKGHIIIGTEMIQLKFCVLQSAARTCIINIKNRNEENGMRMTTKGKYGLRMIAAIAEETEKPISLKCVAKKINVSEKYLEQIIIPIIKAGIVTSVRGVQGGYSLSIPACELSIKTLLEALEGESFLRACVGETGDCGYSEACPLVETFREINEATRAILSSTTVADLVGRNRREVFADAGGNSDVKPACKN